jgi:hypothetical protein
MRHHRGRHAGRPMHGRSPLLVTLSLFLAAGMAFATAVGDQVELHATHQAGVPFHSSPGGSRKFQRVPSGTVATVLNLAPEGRWLQLRLLDDRTGWISSRYLWPAPWPG